MTKADTKLVIDINSFKPEQEAITVTKLIYILSSYPANTPIYLGTMPLTRDRLEEIKL